MGRRKPTARGRSIATRSSAPSRSPDRHPRRRPRSRNAFSRLLMPPIASRFACATTLIVVACTSRTTPAPSSAAGGTNAAITTTDLARRLFTIAHDSMMGRETGSEGAFKTTTYIAAEFQRLGLKPAGDNGTYFQVVPFWRVAADPSSRLSANGAPLAFRRDFL